MKATYKPYRCLVCGHKQSIRTNHEGTCFDYCPACSWKCMGFDSTGNSAQMFGHAYRRFTPEPQS
jgi:hypothetical protein